MVSWYCCWAYVDFESRVISSLHQNHIPKSFFALQFSSFSGWNGPPGSSLVWCCPCRSWWRWHLGFQLGCAGLSQCCQLLSTGQTREHCLSLHGFCCSLGGQERQTPIDRKMVSLAFNHVLATRNGLLVPSYLVDLVRRIDLSLVIVVWFHLLQSTFPTTFSLDYSASS